MNVGTNEPTTTCTNFRSCVACHTNFQLLSALVIASKAMATENAGLVPALLGHCIEVA